MSAAPVAPADRRNPSSEFWARLRHDVRPFLGLASLVLVFGYFAVRAPDTFFTKANIVDNILVSVATLMVIACGQTVVMVVGDFDLSVGMTAGLSGVMMATLLTGSDPAPWWLAVLVAVGVGLVVGVINGLLVAYVGVLAFIATLAMMKVLEGVGLKRAKGQTVAPVLPGPLETIGTGKTFGVYNVLLAAIVFALVLWFVLDRTVLGRRWYAIGGNPEASRYAGLNVRVLRLGAFVLAAFAASLAGVLQVSNISAVSAGGMSGYMLDSIASVFLGMAFFRNGRASIPGTLYGVVIVRILDNGLNLLGVESYDSIIVIGVVIVGAVVLNALTSRRSR
jgi:ribose transport system permease protein